MLIKVFLPNSDTMSSTDIHTQVAWSELIGGWSVDQMQTWLREKTDLGLLAGFLDDFGDFNGEAMVEIFQYPKQYKAIFTQYDHVTKGKTTKPLMIQTRGKLKGEYICWQ